MNAVPEPEAKTIYWHRELPPLDAELMGEHTVEANSGRITGALAYGDHVWERCHGELMNNVRVRLTQEIERLGGHYAHVLDEAIAPAHAVTTGEGWLHGTFTYALYRRPTS